MHQKGTVYFVIPDYIESLPLANTPQVFGLHANAEIGYYTQAARDMWLHLVELQPQTGELAFYLLPLKYSDIFNII